jgi:hypothetical protein
VFFNKRSISQTSAKDFLLGLQAFSHGCSRTSGKNFSHRDLEKSFFDFGRRKYTSSQSKASAALLNE